MYVRYTVHVQKGNKNIIKVVHVTSEGQLEFVEASKIHFGPKITKMMTLFSIVFSFGFVVSVFTTLLMYDAADVFSGAPNNKDNTSAALYVSVVRQRRHCIAE